MGGFRVRCCNGREFECISSGYRTGSTRLRYSPLGKVTGISIASLSVRTDEPEITHQSLSHHCHPEVTETGITVAISGNAFSDH